MDRSLNYLTLSDIREGSASHTHVVEIVSGLKRRGWRIRLYSTNYRSENPSAPERLWEIIRIQLGLLGSVKRCSAVYIRMQFSTFPTALLGKVLGIPIVQELNGLPEDLFIAHPLSRRLAPVIRWLIRKQLQWATHVIVVTEKLREWVENRVGRERITTIPNGANVDLFKPLDYRPPSLPERYALFFGTLAKWQGIEILLKAAQNPCWPDDLSLVIVGDGQERERVAMLAKSNRRILYLGRLPYSKMPEIIAGSMLVVIPANNMYNRSVTGLNPLKLFESLACGVPVIVTDFPGQADLVKKYQCGVVIPHDDVQALVQSLLRLYNDEEMRREMGKKGRKAIQEDHSWDRRAEQTSDVILTVLK